MWYHSWNEQPVGPVEPAQLQGLVASGTITANTFVWREGMADWVEARVSELAALFAPAATVAGGPPLVPGLYAQPMAGVPIHRGFKNFGGLTRSVQVLLVIGAVLTILASLASVWAILVGKSLSDVEAFYETMPMGYWSLLMVAGIAMILVYLALVVTFCIWVHRACANAHALGAVDLKFTPGWAVGWYFPS